jgi:hypothetical protein
VLYRFEQQVHTELRQLDGALASLRGEQGLEIFALNENMLERDVSLSTLDLPLKPFDQAILAAAAELRDAGAMDVCFCEIDADLQPWNKRGDSKQPLASLYDAAGVWVYGDFEFRDQERPGNWPE